MSCRKNNYGCFYNWLGANFRNVYDDLDKLQESTNVRMSKLNKRINASNKRIRVLESKVEKLEQLLEEKENDGTN